MAQLIKKMSKITYQNKTEFWGRRNERSKRVSDVKRTFTPELFEFFFLTTEHILYFLTLYTVRYL